MTVSLIKINKQNGTPTKKEDFDICDNNFQIIEDTINNSTSNITPEDRTNLNNFGDTTTLSTNIVNEIGIINTNITDNSNKIGDLSTLTTVDKTNVVNAIKENTTQLLGKANDTDSNRTTTAKDVTGAINELNSGKANLVTTAQQTTSDVVYYVDAVNGNDTNTGISTGMAFKTIQHAINKIPQIVNHNVTVNVLSGTYNESPIVSGFVGRGRIYLYGDTVQSTTRNILLFSFYNCNCIISVRGFYLTSISYHSITAQQCTNLSLQYLKLGGSTTSYSGLNAQYSNVYIAGSDLSNRQYGIYADSGGIVTSVNNTGTGNTVGLQASHASIIAQDGTQPSGTTTTATYGGGQIR